MSNYFENRISKPDMFSRDYIADAMQILESALEHEEKSTAFFEDSNDNSNSEEMQKQLWNMSMEETQRAHGLIDAYNIITGREIICVRCAIRDELDYVKNINADKMVVGF